MRIGLFRPRGTYQDLLPPVSELRATCLRASRPDDLELLCSDLWLDCTRSMTASRLTIKLEATSFEFASNFSIMKASEPAHLCCHYDGVVVALRSGGEGDFTLTFAPCLNQLPGDVASDVEGLGNGPACAARPCSSSEVAT
jgi:hypothetical protein